tara:strand:+ start:262 stop:543 length:282 start_codon:yes stop_codon:yes gene_type:complete
MMEKIFFITAMMLNIETGELGPKYQQMIYFYDRISCENYVQQNFTALKNGFQIYMDSQGINGKLTSMGCTGLTKQDIIDLELEIDDDDDTLST